MKELQKGSDHTLSDTNITMFIEYSALVKVGINLAAFLLNDLVKVKSDVGIVFFNQPIDILWRE